MKIIFDKKSLKNVITLFYINMMHMQLNSSPGIAHTALIYQIQRSGTFWWNAFLMFAIYDQTHENIVLTRVPPAFFCFFSVFSRPILPILPILPTFQILPTLPIAIGFSPVVLSEGQSKDMACQSFQCIVKIEIFETYFNSLKFLPLQLFQPNQVDYPLQLPKIEQNDDALLFSDQKQEKNCEMWKCEDLLTSNINAPSTM